MPKSAEEIWIDGYVAGCREGYFSAVHGNRTQRAKDAWEKPPTVAAIREDRAEMVSDAEVEAFEKGASG